MMGCRTIPRGTLHFRLACLLLVALLGDEGGRLLLLRLGGRGGGLAQATEPKIDLNIPTGECTLEGSTVEFRWSLTTELVYFSKFSIIDVSSGETLAENDGGINLKVPNIDTGVYLCRGVATGSGVEIDSNTVNLTVYTRDTFVVPTIQYPIYGSSAFEPICGHKLPVELLDEVLDSDDNSVSFSDVDLLHEGSYKCRFLWVRNSECEIEIDFEVIVVAPPKVFASPDPYTLLTENKENYTLSVTFENRGEPSNVLWLKDGDQIPDESATSLTQTTIGSVDVTTVRTFPLLSRADSGVYRVEVVNLSPGVLENQSRADAVFQVEVKVLPSVPTNLHFTNKSAFEILCEWDTSHTYTDQAASNFSMDVLNLNTGEHGVIDVPCTSGSGGVGEACGGQVSSYTLAVLPGMRYRAFLVATNVDGSANTSHVEFRSEIGPASISTVQVVRTSLTSFDADIQLHYNGGMKISHFDIAYRYNNTGSWVAVELEPGTVIDGLVHALSFEVGDIEYHLGPLDFQVKAVNSGGLVSEPVVTGEMLVVPGSPQQLRTRDDITEENATVVANLSSEGSVPILQVVLTLSDQKSGQVEATVVMDGLFMHDEEVVFEIGDLREGRGYLCTVYAVNYAGAGEESKALQFNTPGHSADSPTTTSVTTPLPSPFPPLSPSSPTNNPGTIPSGILGEEWFIPVLVALPAMVVLCLVVIAMSCTCYFSHRRNAKEEYAVNQTPMDVEKHLEFSANDARLRLASRSSVGSSAFPSGRSSSGGRHSRPLTPRSPTTEPESAEPMVEQSSGSEVKILAMDCLQQTAEDIDNTTETDGSESACYPRYTYQVSPSPIDLNKFDINQKYFFSSKESTRASVNSIIAIPTSYATDV